MTDTQLFELIGFIYFVVGIGILINPDFYKKAVMGFMENPSTVYLGGLAALIIGFLLIRFHNVWHANRTVIITIIGWIALIKGLFLILQPKVSMKINSFFIEGTDFLKVWGVIAIILGVLFCWLGYTG